MIKDSSHIVIFRTYSKKSKLSFIDTKKVVDHNYFEDYTFVKMNEVEWDRCVEKGDPQYIEWMDRLIVTMSERGCKYFDQIFPSIEQ